MVVIFVRILNLFNQISYSIFHAFKLVKYSSVNISLSCNWIDVVK